VKGVRLRCRRPHEEEVAEFKGLREGPDFPGLTRDHEILVHLSVRPARVLLTRIPVRITLNRPHADNAITTELAAQLIEILD